MHVIGELFSWPDGIVVGNLIASALWAGPALLHLDRRMRKRHEQLKTHIQALHQDPGHGPH
jgi:hypothetical protein